MSRVITAELISKGMSFEQVKNLYSTTDWMLIPDIVPISYASSSGYIYVSSYPYCSGKNYKISNDSPSRLYDCNNSKNIYTRITIHSKTYKAHRLIASAFLGVSTLEVNHKDCNKGNNKINNLEYMTRRENMLHAVANERFPKHLNLTDAERERRHTLMVSINKKQELGIIPRSHKSVKWTEERKIKHKELIKSRIRDEYGKFCKEGDIHV